MSALIDSLGQEFRGAVLQSEVNRRTLQEGSPSFIRTLPQVQPERSIECFIQMKKSNARKHYSLVRKVNPAMAEWQLPRWRE
ncbi:hypothetical protein BA950_03410 [Erythrobacter sp. SAORIC-644]|nr:hypothetical protein BA950_03410 [Erythrobacter sp. SAORIC-644]